MRVSMQDLQDLPACVYALSFAFPRSQIEGKENLPAKDQPAVYVANHQSFLVRRTMLRHLTQMLA